MPVIGLLRSVWHRVVRVVSARPFAWALVAAVLLVTIGYFDWRHRLGEFDLIIYNGRVFDGERWLGRATCVGIRGGLVRRVGFLYGARSKARLNARGQVVAPGFIDVHTHVEHNIPKTRAFHAGNFVGQGVTTIITGNCGTSSLEVGDLLGRIDRYGGQVNLATLVGHNSIREKVLGMGPAEPGARQMAEMTALVDANMAAGALGISTGLAYAPGCFSQRDEVVALVKAAARDGGLYATHIRDEGVESRAALEEAIETARLAGIALHISHFKIAAAGQWGQVRERLERVEAARKQGLRITLDAYCYDASSSSMDLMLPPQFRGNRLNWREMANPAERKAAAGQILAQLRRAGFRDFGYARVAVSGAEPELEGKSIPEIAALLHMPAGLPGQVDAMFHLLGKGGAQMVYHDMNEKDVEIILADPHVVLGTDSAVRSPRMRFAHPRGVGNFARFLDYYVHDGLLPLDEALRKITSRPADIFGLTDRGRIREGRPADITIFDPDKIRDNTTFAAPLRPPSGISYVLVNGYAVVSGGAVRAVFPGRALRRATGK